MSAGGVRSIRLFTAQSAALAAPTLPTQGVPVYHLADSTDQGDGAGFRDRLPLEASLVIKGSGTGTVTFTGGRLWGYHTASAQWYPLGTGTDADKGKINGGTALGETGTDLVQHAEPILYLGHFDRVYLEGTPGGTTPSFEAWILVPRTRF